MRDAISGDRRFHGLPGMTCGSFLPFPVFLQALIQGVTLIVNAIAEALAGLRASIIGAPVRAL